MSGQYIRYSLLISKMLNLCSPSRHGMVVQLDIHRKGEYVSVLLHCHVPCPASLLGRCTAAEETAISDQRHLRDLMNILPSVKGK